MNPRVTVGLLAVLVALGAYVYFGPQQSATGAPGAPGAPGATATPVLDLWKVDDQQVASVTVTEAAGQGGVQRNGTDWVVMPSGDAADSLRVNSVIFRLASLRATRRLDAITSLDDYGLASPAMTATVTLVDGTVHTLKFGAQAPAQSGTYALSDADPTVYLLSTALATDVERLVSDPPRQPPPSPSPSPSPDA
jgi:hypothetical protein